MSEQSVKKGWADEELLLALRLYSNTPFGRLHRSNPDIIQLAKVIERSPSAVAMKAVNFASLDPYHQARGRKGLGNASHADREMWNRFWEAPNELAAQMEEAWETRVGIRDSVDHPETTPIQSEAVALVKTRRIQTFFRNAVLASYGNRCAITGIDVPSLLNASHIIPWSHCVDRRADPTNGIALNALHDRAFDRGMLTISEDNLIQLSHVLEKNAKSGFSADAFASYSGKMISLPERFSPDPEALRFHRENTFIG